MSMKVRDMVRNIRTCKTAAEERAVISKECALIRTAFKEEDTVYRQRNVSKLLFIHLLGYPTQFAQMECVKLIASHKFCEKRIGYLGLTQLLEEGADILMLVTNSIGNDLQHTNQHVNGLALTALGNIASPEMCMALAQEVNQLMTVSNPFLRKKAVLCAVRMVRKVDEIQDKFDQRIASLLDDRNHGVLLATCALIITLLEVNRTRYVKLFRKHISQLVRILRGVLMSGYTNSAEYDISGITDPFLQSRILAVLRILGKGSHKRSDQMSDVLAQVATNTESSKTAGSAVLYEGVRTIMTVEADSALRVLGVNILARFLQNKDHNIRYVALSVLQQVVKVDMKAVQRHRNTVLECLKDGEMSTKRRALDVSFALINEENIKTMTKELLNLLLVSQSEFKNDLVSKICLAVDRYAPNRRWQIDTLIRAMCLAGNHVQDEVRDSFIQTVGSTTELQQYAVHKLYFSAQENMAQESLVQCAVWSLGEFGDHLVAGRAVGPDGANIQITPTAVLDLLDSIAKRPMTREQPMTLEGSSPSNSTESMGLVEKTAGSGAAYGCGSFARSPVHVTQEFLLTCLLKLTTRFPSEIPRIRRMSSSFSRSISIELQQRACESDELLTTSWDDTRANILDRMPVPQRAKTLAERRPTGDDSITEVMPVGNSVDDKGGASKAKNAAPAAGGNLLDLQSLLDLDTPTAGAPTAAPAETTAQGPVDVVGDLLGGLSLSTAPAAATAGGPNAAADLLGIASSNPVPSAPSSVTPFDKNGLRVRLELPHGYSDADKLIDIVSHSTNSSPDPITNFIFEVAVPKYMKLEMQPASADTLPGLGQASVSQRIKLDVTAAREQKRPVALKCRLSFTQRGQTVQELIHVASLRPSGDADK